MIFMILFTALAQQLFFLISCFSTFLKKASAGRIHTGRKVKQQKFESSAQREKHTTLQRSYFTICRFTWTITCLLRHFQEHQGQCQVQHCTPRPLSDQGSFCWHLQGRQAATGKAMGQPEDRISLHGNKVALACPLYMCMVLQWPVLIKGLNGQFLQWNRINEWMYCKAFSVC